MLCSPIVSVHPHRLELVPNPAPFIKGASVGCGPGCKGRIVQWSGVDGNVLDCACKPPSGNLCYDSSVASPVVYVPSRGIARKEKVLVPTISGPSFLPCIKHHVGNRLCVWDGYNPLVGYVELVPSRLK